MGAHLSTRKVKRIQQLLTNWLPGVASGHLASPEVDSLDSHRESTLPARGPRKSLKWIRNLARIGRGGFQVDSPVRIHVASEMPRCAPPHTFRAGEEPVERGQATSLTNFADFGSKR